MDFARLVEPVETTFLQIEQRLTKEFRWRSAGRFLCASLRNCLPRRRGDSKLVQNVKAPPGRERQDTRRNFVRTVAPNFRPAFNAKSLPAARKEQPQIIINLRRRRHVRTRIPRGILLPDRHRRRDPGNFVHIRFFHALQKLASIGRERLDVTTLALRINGVKCERRFSGAADASNHGNGVMRNLDADIFQIVDAGAADADGLLRRPDIRGCVGNLFGRQGEAQTARFERTA